MNGFRSFPDVDLQICTIARRPGARRLQVGTYYIGRGLSPIRTLLPVGNPPRGSHADAHAERPPHSQNAHRTAIHQHTHKRATAPSEQILLQHFHTNNPPCILRQSNSSRRSTTSSLDIPTSANVRFSATNTRHEQQRTTSAEGSRVRQNGPTSYQCGGRTWDRSIWWSFCVMRGRRDAARRNAATHPWLRMLSRIITVLISCALQPNTDDRLRELEKKTGQPKVYFFVLFVGVITSVIFGLGGMKLVSDLMGFAYPA